MEEKQQEEKVRYKGYSKKKVIAIVLTVLVVIGAGVSIALTQMSKNPAFCASCHIIQPYYQSWKSSNLLANKHAEKGVECLDCHHQGYAEKVQEGLKFITGNYESPLKEREFSREECLKCHEDFDKVIAATDFGSSNPHDAHFADLECNLCHKMHRKSEVYCAQCHQFEWFENLDDSWEIGSSTD